jgi:hypothetical protein
VDEFLSAFGKGFYIIIISLGLIVISLLPCVGVICDEINRF